MSGGKTVEVVNPFDLKAIGSVSLLSWNTIDSYLTQAAQLHANRKNWRPAHQRAAVLRKAGELVQGRFDELAFQIANEGGKPLVDARVEVKPAIDGIGLCISEMGALEGKQIPMDLTAAGAGRIAFTQREPIGPVLAVSAFNHPLNPIVHQVAPAVATGCPVLIKPADDTPLSYKSFVDILYEAGLPEGWCRFVPCDVSTAEKMVTEPRVAFFTFIGSGKVGWMLRSKLAPGTRCALEHGGAAPVILDETADIEAMIPSLVKGGFYHSGQVCVSVQRVFAPKSMSDDIAKLIAEAASKLTVGNAIHEDTDAGPLIRPKEVDRVAQWVDEAKTGGARIVTGGEKLGKTTYAPTVLLRPELNAKVSQSEIFGPVVFVYDYDTLDASVLQANALLYAFQASVFS